VLWEVNLLNEPVNIALQQAQLRLKRVWYFSLIKADECQCSIDFDLLEKGRCEVASFLKDLVREVKSEDVKSSVYLVDKPCFW